MRLLAAPLLTLLAWACAATPPATSSVDSPAVIRIPSAADEPRADDAPPPRAEPLPGPPGEDPYLYYVGKWDGVVNDKLNTQLTVTEGGTFHVHLPPHAHRPICDLWGKLRVSSNAIYLDIEHSTCQAESVGTTLERIIVSKTSKELVVRNADSSMVVRYTRRAE